MPTETTRDVHQVLTEYLEVRDASRRAYKLRAELLSLLGETHTHDPRRCMTCMQQNAACAFGGRQW